jgi:pimeloyl-ACP methyl ester carboxylesterase
MPKLAMNQRELRRAMRDPRYSNIADREHGAYRAWVTEGFQALQAASPGEGGTVTVEVRSYGRVRDGRRERVDAYRQQRQRGRGHERAAPRPEVAPAEQAAPPTPAPLLLIFVSGAADVKMNGPVRQSGIERTAEDAGVPNVNFTWDQRAEIEELIRRQSPETRIRLIGHSYGADTAAQISERMGILGRPPLDMLVTLDPVGWFQRSARPDFYENVRAGTARWINVNATGGSSLEPSNFIAGLGGAWNYGPVGRADEFINAPVPHVAFGDMMASPTASGRSILDEVRAP